MSGEETPEQTSERMGVEKVRTLVHTGGLPTQRQLSAVNWLAEKDRESRLRSEASQAEQSLTARSAKKAAWIAAIAAIIAVPLAIISIVIACLSWLYPR